MTLGWSVGCSTRRKEYSSKRRERKDRLDEFVLRIEKERPPRSSIQSLEYSFLDPLGYSGFEIRESDTSGACTTLVLPDIATCPDCVREIFDLHDRRYRYPFTNCTNCGPRFTIINSLPYDRVNTSMRNFKMCADCRREYEEPLDRRFHAQPNACPRCGPQLELWDERGGVIATADAALCEAADAIRAGKIVAIKGLGGFHLVVDARNDLTVTRLRERKRREEKPFALMAPSLEEIKALCEVSDFEERLLLAPEAPIVLLRRNSGSANRAVSLAVAPRNPYLGIMLPYTPLHHLFMRELGFFIVATSANLSDEPICTDEAEAVERLRGIADLFLIHNRPIVRHADDSVTRIMGGRELVLRRARGYAPLPVRLKQDAPALLAVGGQLKNSVAITAGPQVFISQHIGDLETEAAFRAFQDTIESLQRLYGVTPERHLCDLHPEYLSTKYARERASVYRCDPASLRSRCLLYGGKRTGRKSFGRCLGWNRLRARRYHLGRRVSAYGRRNLSPGSVAPALSSAGRGAGDPRAAADSTWRIVRNLWRRAL